MRTLPAIPLVILLAGCGAKQAPAPPAEPEVPIQLTASGPSPAPETPVSRASIEAAYPGYDVAGDGARFAVRWDGETLLLIDAMADGQFMAKAVDARVAGPDDLRVGDAFGRVRSRGEIQCRRGQGDWVGQVYCTLAELPGFTFAFELDESETPECGADCVLPSVAPLEGKTIDFIDWMAP